MKKKELFNNQKLKNKYENYLKNKRVVLVGPGHHTKNAKQHDMIESYDIVVRINDGIGLAKKYPEDIGRRTDILYCVLNKMYFKQLRYGPLVRETVFTEKKIVAYKKFLKWISITHAHLNSKHVWTLKEMNRKAKIPIYLVEKNVYKNVKKGNDKKVSAGIVTIYDLLQHEIKELYITGISFFDRTTVKVKNNKIYRSGYIRRIVSKSSRLKHDIKKELKFFVELCKNDKRIICDDVLSRIVEDNWKK